MKTALSVRKICFCIASFQLLYMGIVGLSGKFLHGSILLIWYLGLLIVLYYYHFAEWKLLCRLFSLLNLPYFQKQLQPLWQKIEQFSVQMQQHTLLYIVFALVVIILGITSILLASVSIFLLEVYWFTDFPLGNSFCPILWGLIAFLLKLGLVSLAWVTSTKEKQTMEGQML